MGAIAHLLLVFLRKPNVARINPTVEIADIATTFTVASVM